MSRRPAPGALVAGALVATVLAAPLAIGRSAAASPVVVGLVGPPDDRLTEEVGRELAIARFAIVRIDLRIDRRADLTGAGSGADAGAGGDELAAVPADLPLGVLVAPDDRRLVVFARQALGAGLHTRIEIQVDPRDHLARRRACIAVVEYLRVLAEGTRLPSVSAVEPGAPEARAPLRPTPPGTAPPSPPALRSPVSSQAVGPAPPPGPPSPSPSIMAATHAPAAIATRPERAAVSPAQRRWWSMGIATALDLSGAVAGATAHLQFIWRTRLGSHLAIRARGLWPLLGSGLASDGRDVRMWTFGVAADAQYFFVDADAIVRPFLGVTGGARLIVTDTGVLAAPESGSSMTPTATLGLQAGLAYRVSSVVELFVEVEANRDWLIPGVKRSGYQATIADATSLHSSIGALFDY